LIDNDLQWGMVSLFLFEINCWFDVGGPQFECPMLVFFDLFLEFVEVLVNDLGLEVCDGKWGLGEVVLFSHETHNCLLDFGDIGFGAEDFDAVVVEEGVLDVSPMGLSFVL
jgi:hypothetical protein